MEIGILPILSFINPPTNSLDAVEEKKGVLYILTKHTHIVIKFSLSFFKGFVRSRIQYVTRNKTDSAGTT